MTADIEEMVRELERLDRDATNGPWRAVKNSHSREGKTWIVGGDAGWVFQTLGKNPRGEVDAKLVVLLRNLTPWWRPALAACVDPRQRTIVVAAQELSDRADAFMAQFDDRDSEPEMIALDAAREKLFDALLAPTQRKEKDQ